LCQCLRLTHEKRASASHETGAQRRARTAPAPSRRGCACCAWPAARSRNRRSAVQRVGARLAPSDGGKLRETQHAGTWCARGGVRCARHCRLHAAGGVGATLLPQGTQRPDARQTTR
jgi:hypothetical protein